MSPDDRALLIADAPDTYYVTDYHRKHPVVLVRLSRIDRDALRDILTVSWRLTAAKSRRAPEVSAAQRPLLTRASARPSS